MRRPILIIAALAVLCGAFLWFRASMETDAGVEPAVRAVVERFGGRLKSVSLLGPEDETRRQIRDAYAPLVSDELLSAWLENPSTAPGRLASSPWPDRIGITSISRREDAYNIAGNVVMMTSVEAASPGDDAAGIRPMTMTVAEVSGEWTITAFAWTDLETHETRTYIGPEAAWEISYPREMFTVLGAGNERAVHAGSYIPPCADGFEACLVYGADAYAGTNFDSAGVGIFRTDVASRQACESTQRGSIRQNAHGATINGREFTVFETGDAAMSHVARDTVYVTWHDETCYQLVARIGFSRFEVYEPGTIRQFTDEAREDLRIALHAVVSSFELRPDT